jgi:amidophosphoribosyltransferase
MSKLGDFIAFKAAIALLKERGQEELLTELLEKCKDLQRNSQLHTENIVRQVYKPFAVEEISNKIAELITPKELNIPVNVIYQTIESLHEACPNNKGDWYFTGNYPTPGGNRVCNKAFMNYMEGKNVRGY